MKVTTDSCLFGAWAADEMQKAKSNRLTALDIGGGTGLLSLMIAQQNNLEIDVIEIDPAAAAQAEQNIAASPWSNRIKIIRADVQHWQPPATYDCIFSNPPFYETDLHSPDKNKNIAHHSAGLTLQQLLHFIHLHLAPDGIFFLLLPAKRENNLESLLQTLNFHLHCKTLVRQTTRHQPFRFMIKAGRKKTDRPVTDEISIRNENNEYTGPFVDLLKEYYLHL